MDLLSILISVIAGLGGLLFYNVVKRKSAEGVLANLETKKQENAIDQEIAKNSGLVEAEQERQKQVQKQIEEQKNAPSTPKDDTDFFNSKLKP